MLNKISHHHLLLVLQVTKTEHWFHLNSPSQNGIPERNICYKYRAATATTTITTITTNTASTTGDCAYEFPRTRDKIKENKKPHQQRTGSSRAHQHSQPHKTKCKQTWTDYNSQVSEYQNIGEKGIRYKWENVNTPDNIEMEYKHVQCMYLSHTKYIPNTPKVHRIY